MLLVLEFTGLFSHYSRGPSGNYDDMASNTIGPFLSEHCIKLLYVLLEYLLKTLLKVLDKSLLVSLLNLSSLRWIYQYVQANFATQPSNEVKQYLDVLNKMMLMQDCLQIKRLHFTLEGSKYQPQNGIIR